MHVVVVHPELAVAAVHFEMLAAAAVPLQPDRRALQQRWVASRVTTNGKLA